MLEFVRVFLMELVSWFGCVCALFQANSSSKSVVEARWDELRNKAVSKGAQLLRGCLEETGRDELRSLAVAGSIRAKMGDRRLTVAQLRSALMEALAPTEQAQSLCFDYK